MAAHYLFKYISLLVLLVQQALTFSLYPTVDPDKLAAALKISIECLDALNTTVACDDDLFQWTVTVDDHWWSQDNLTTLCTSACSASAKEWESNVASACVDDDLTIYGKQVPAYTVSGRFTDGLGIACLQSNTMDWCMIESLNWVGSDVIRPDCTVDPTNPSCSDPSNVTAENQRIANLYNDTMLCSDCFMKMFYQRLSSDYLPDSDHSDYLVGQFYDIQDVCSTTVGNLSTRAFYPYPAATTYAANATITVTNTTATGTATATTAAANTTSTTTTSSIMTPTPTQTGMVSKCNDFYKAASNDSCYSIATAHNITLTDFENWNAAVGANCTGLLAGNYYCIGIILDSTSSSCQMVDTSAGITTTNATLACNQLSLTWGVTTGDLIKYTGSYDCYSANTVCLPPACSLMQVPANATCDSIAASLASNSTIGNITTTQLLSWNPNIIGTCDDLLEGQYICNGTPGGCYAPPPNPTGTANAGGQERGGPGGADPTAITGMSISQLVTSQPFGSKPTAAPAPTQVGIVSNCNQYSQAQTGDSCSKFASENNITTDELYDWNPFLGAGGANCTSMFQTGYYYCTGVNGSSSSPTTTPSSAPTSTTSGTVPSPTQSGIVSNCSGYAQAQSGDYCSQFASKNSITTAELYEWNTALGTDGANCNSDFWIGYYYCVGVSGSSGNSSSPTTTPSSAPTSTTSGTVPSPTPSGIVSNCSGYAQAQSGDYCSQFASKNSITAAELYEWNTALGTDGANCNTEFWTGYYYCISVN